MFDLLREVLNRDPGIFVATLGITFGCTVGIVGIIMGAWSKTRRFKEQEQTRREVAAYIAEGSMTPEQGERLLTAGKSSRCGDKV